MVPVKNGASSHNAWSSRRHWKHCSHGPMIEQITWSPGRTAVTPSPHSTTTPAASWPSTIGYGTGTCPLVKFKSVWQTPTAATATFTSPAHGDGSSISSTRTSPGAQHTTAFTRPPSCAGPQQVSGPLGHGAHARLTVGGDRHAVDEDVVDAARLVGDQAFLVAREVAHAAQRTGLELVEVDDDQVGRRPGRQTAAVVHAEEVGELGGELVHRVLHRHRRAVAHPVREQLGGHARVAQLRDVRAGYGLAEH